MRRRSFSFIALPIVLLASGQAAAQSADPCQFDAVCRFLEQNIGLKPPLTLAALRQFAKVESETASPVANRHVAGQIDSIRQLKYAGLTLQVYAPATGAVLLQRIDLTSDRYPLPLKLVFGKSTFDDVQFALGLPKTIDHFADGTSRWNYVNVESTESFTFVFDPEPSMKIRSVQWLFAVD